LCALACVCDQYTVGNLNTLMILNVCECKREINRGRKRGCVCVCVYINICGCLCEGRKKYIMLCECDHSKHRNCVWREREWIRLRERERNNKEETSDFSLKCLWIFKF